MIMTDHEWTLKEIVEQLKLCNFVDTHGHPLEKNMAFIALEKRAEQEE